MRIALKFAYDGRKYFGFARQPKLKTVEGQILNLLIKKGFMISARDSNYQTASRTDKGASAFGNVIGFDTNLTKDDILNSILGVFDDIIIYGYAFVDYDFYPRHAKVRVYRYFLLKEDFKLEDLFKIITVFTGIHNFKNFARVENHKNPLREIDNIVIEEIGDFFAIDFYAQTYLWHQIRRIISAVVKVLQGKNTIEDVVFSLDNPNRNFDFGLACAEPLILKDIRYSFNFDYPKGYRRKIAYLERKIVEGLK